MINIKRFIHLFIATVMVLIGIVVTPISVTHDLTGQSAEAWRPFEDTAIERHEDYPIEQEASEPVPEQVFHYIPWRFNLYHEPEFRAGRIAFFEPREVHILHQRRYDERWAYVSLDEIEGWVYLPSDRIYIDRILGVYNGYEGELIERFMPGIVTVLERRESWLRIETNQDASPDAVKWINLDFVPPVEGLISFLEQYERPISVHYENIETGFVFQFDGERRYFGASATKAPFALYIYHMAEMGLTDLESVHTYTEADYWIGSGFIRLRHEFGDTFTQRELLHLMIAPSDNIATRMLRRVHGTRGYRQFIEGLGGNPDYLQNITYSYLSANEAGFYLREIYRFVTSGSPYGEEFLGSLLRNRYPFIISDYPVASKSGWAYNFGGVYHDMAIVFAPSPYLLAVLSTREGTRTDQRDFERISMHIQEFNDMWFEAGPNETGGGLP
jgi:beta-lactamase class A